MKRTVDELYPLELLSGLDDDMVAEAMLPDKITHVAPVPVRRKPRPIPSLAHSSRAAAWLTVLVSVTVLLGVILAAGLAEGWRSQEEDNPFPDFAPDAGRPNEDKSDATGESTADTTAPDTTPSDPNGDTWPEATEDFSYFQKGYLLSDVSWEGDEWLLTYGDGVQEQLKEIMPTLTAVTRPVGKTVSFKKDRLWTEDMDIRYLRVYDTQGNELYGDNYTSLSTLPKGTYCVVLTVRKDGDYIEEQKAREYSVYEYAFILRLTEVIDGVDQSLTVRLGRRTYTLPPFLRSQTTADGVTVDFRGVDSIQFDQYDHDDPVEHEGALVPRLYMSDLHDVEVLDQASGSRFVSLEVYHDSYDGEDVLLARFDDDSYRTRLRELDGHADYGIFTFEIREGEQSALVEYPFSLHVYRLTGHDPFDPNPSITVSVGGKTMVPVQYGGWASSIVIDENGEEHMVNMDSGFRNALFDIYLDLLPSVTAPAGTPFALGGLKEDEETPLVYSVYDMYGADVDYSLDELSSLKPGAYCVIFTVSSKGRYSEKYDAYESSGSHYGFYLVVE